MLKLTIPTPSDYVGLKTEGPPRLLGIIRRYGKWPIKNFQL
jgi:hypothetical protein